MNRISETFHRLKTLNEKALIPYVTPEYPVQGTTVPLVLALEKAGASMIEIGIPFSDPLADGPVIQHSSEIAIRNGATIQKIFESVRTVRGSTDIPLILMGYYNPILHYGVDKFLSEAKESGVDGFIVPDLLPEESEAFRKSSRQNGLSNIFLVAPTSSDQRIKDLDALSTDFTYCVSVTGVTGARNTFGGHFGGFLNRVKANTSKPFVVGFGIQNREQIEQISSVADGVVVGSALMQAVGSEKTIDGVVAAANSFISNLK